MRLYYDKKSKNPTYWVSHCYRNNKKTTTKNIHRIGKHSELLEQGLDPLEYANKIVKEFREAHEQNAIIEIPLRVTNGGKLEAEGRRSSESDNLYNVGYLVLQHIYNKLNIKEFFRKKLKDRKITFGCDAINRFLIYGRILCPSSKRALYRKLNTFYNKPDFGSQHMYRFMDVLYNYYPHYLDHLYKASTKIVPRDTSVCYFDCTNYYFESGEDLEPYIDYSTGEIIEPLKRYGISKENRPNPIVQMGLFVDRNGLPLIMCIRPGNENEQNCALPTEKELLKMLEGKRIIYCADAGLGSYDIRHYNSLGGRAFIITQSLKKLSSVMQVAAFNDHGFLRMSNNSPVTLEYMKTFDKDADENIKDYNDIIYKVIDADKEIDLGFVEEVVVNGKTVTRKAKGMLCQQIIVTYSRKRMEYQRHVRNKQIERAKALIEKKNKDEIKKGPNDVTRFIKRISKGSDGKKATDTYEIDLSIIEKEEKYDGFYAIATNIYDDPREIIQINAKRYQIEDNFRVLKTHMSARPVYHSLSIRIFAHFVICFTALLIYRILELILNQGEEHFTISEILDTLKIMNVSNVSDVSYRTHYKGSKVLNEIEKNFNLGLNTESIRPADLNKITRK